MSSKQITAVRNRNLPIFSSQGKDKPSFDIDKVGDTLDSFRKGEKGWFGILKLIAMAGLGWAAWVYVIPPLFQAIGKVMAVAGSVILILALIVFAPVIFKALRRFARFTHKAVIKHDPFGELYEQKEKMYANKERFQLSRGTISALQQEAETKSSEAEEAVEDIKKKIPRIEKELTKIDATMAEILQEKGDAGKYDDEYLKHYTDRQKLKGETRRATNFLEQKEDFVRKYGMRNATLKRFGQKLLLIDSDMEIKILDFDATIEILEDDYKFAKEARAATSAAKSAMHFDENWELEYAIEVVTETIARDVAITAGNLNDIDRLTSGGLYSLEDDSIFEELELLSAEISSGNHMSPVADKYLDPEYIPNKKDRKANTGFGELYD
jgi:hypothetical protein